MSKPIKRVTIIGAELDENGELSVGSRPGKYGINRCRFTAMLVPRKLWKKTRDAAKPANRSNVELAKAYAEIRHEVCARFHNAEDQELKEASVGVESENGYIVKTVYEVRAGKLVTADHSFNPERCDVGDLAALLHQLKP